MNICIYHNLKQGGGLYYLNQVSKEFQKKYSLEVYSFQKNPYPNTFNTYHYTKLKKTKNIFELKQKSKAMAEEIKRKKFDLIIVTNDHLTQSPHILKYLGHRNNCLYISHEPIREYYEKTTYKHDSVKNILSRLIRISTKYIDMNNCRKATNIVTNSYYSQSIFSKIYKKNSYVICPGLDKTKPTKITCNYTNKFISFGPYSKTKGHHLSIKYALENNPNNEVTIVGYKNNDLPYLVKKYKNKKIKFLIDITEKEINRILSQDKIYFANQINEPFGISTLETVDKKKMVIGLNLGGTSKIIDSGVNGILYPQNNKLINKILKYVTGKENMKIYTIKKIDWKETTTNILRLYHFLKNESAY